MAINLKDFIALKSAQLIKYVKTDAPRIVGKMHRDHIQEAFDAEGYTDSQFEPWQEVKRRKESRMKKGKKGQALKNQKAAQRHKILHSSENNLKSSFGYEVVNDGVEIGTDVPYAQAHNEGTTNAGRNRNVKIPRRKFLGKSKALEAKIKAKFSNDITKILNQ